MSAIYAPVVNRADSFDADLAALRAEFPKIDEAVDDLEEGLKCAWSVPHTAVGSGPPNTYATLVDYAAAGSGGVGKFLVTYHATQQAANPMSQPLRTYTLLSIDRRTE